MGDDYRDLIPTPEEFEEEVNRTGWRGRRKPVSEALEEGGDPSKGGRRLRDFFRVSRDIGEKRHADRPLEEAGSLEETDGSAVTPDGRIHPESDRSDGGSDDPEVSPEQLGAPDPGKSPDEFGGGPGSGQPSGRIRRVTIDLPSEREPEFREVESGYLGLPTMPDPPIADHRNAFESAWDKGHRKGHLLERFGNAERDRYSAECRTCGAKATVCIEIDGWTSANSPWVVKGAAVERTCPV